MGPKAPPGGVIRISGPLDNVPATFLCYPITPILPKPLQALPQGAKMVAV